MQINSPEQLALGRRLLRAYGNSWGNVTAAGTRGEDGVLYVDLPPEPERKSAGAKVERFGH